MHNSEEFINKFNQASIFDVMTKFFDEIMVLYNLIGERDINNIELNNDSIASFIINTFSIECATRIYNDLNGTSFNVYGSSYDIHVATSNSESVVIVITKTPSL